MAISSTHAAPRLADHVRACLVGDQMIFLDLDRSRYIGLGGPQLQALAEAILDEPPGNRTSKSPSHPAFIEGWLQRLAKQQLLSDTPIVRREQHPRLLEPVASLDTDDEHGDLDWSQLLRLWRSTWVTAIWLRNRSLAEISNRVIAMRSRHSNRDRSLDQEAMRSAASSYLRLRIFAATTHDRCLNDSLALVHFLACQGFFAQWVIGVRVHPFCAHSWVQHAGVVLNDVPERVRSYRPILIV